MATPRVLVNGRFARVPVTGVQRYGRELIGALATRRGELEIAVPGIGVSAVGRDDPFAGLAVDERWSGGRGHAWEQLALPRLARGAGTDLVLSPCNWGPLRLEAQLVVFHDVAPLSHPQYFVPAYVRWSRLALPRLARTARRSIATCERVRDDLVERTGVDPDRVAVVPPGVGAPFATAPLGDLSRRADRCVFVGGHDRRKNLEFLLRLWPRVQHELGLELHVVRRGWVSTRRADERPAGDTATVFHDDPTDDELAALYAGALCVLQPSHYEGYGLPLLEAMATGTPFLSSDTGAARELAVTDGQVLPLDDDAWFAQLRSWAGADLSDVRRRGADAARAQTWGRGATVLDELIRAVG